MNALRVGDDIGSYGPLAMSIEDSVRWAAASGDLTPFHFDPQAAADRGFEGPVVHGPWKAAVLRGLVQRWLGKAVLRSFSADYLAPDLLGEPMVFGGSITGVGVTTDGATQVDCELWVKRADGSLSVRATCAAVVEEELDGLPLERVKQSVRLGEVAGVFVYEVTSGDIARFIEAVTGEPVDRDDIDEAPATFYAALDPVERRDLDLDDFVQHLPFRKTGGGNAFNEVSAVRPIRAGDVVTVTTRYTEVYEKKGSRGSLLFRVRENELTDAAGERIATTRCGHVLSFDLTSRTVTPRAEARA
ncbi:MaoC family dehydratase N-terminal domain-containing protein [Microbacterium sp. AK031]|uniref:FAS1-like dehydratase domain-containing protein n=1 Tax=Microbacterium sp. AK031 TaxID=2723076 RepID=UPI002167E009|nr:MaoC family dehydratase N-terminal domain-containing protein [Microbacterium sp. AK031]MCS3843376.1 acyl dehydratase [Microbacterium sp. AK031]